MCNCIKETEERFKKHLKNNDPEFKDIEDFEVGFENKAFIFNEGTTDLVLPLEVSWKHTAKTGRVSTKRKKQSFMMDYCPFCGEKKGKARNI